MDFSSALRSACTTKELEVHLEISIPDEKLSLIHRVKGMKLSTLKKVSSNHTNQIGAMECYYRIVKYRSI